MTPILEITDIDKAYGSFLLDKVSMRLEEGFIMGLVGPNGAGKTTIIKLILNLIRKDGGSVKIFGREVSEDENIIKNKIGFVLDDPGWYDMFTIREMAKIISPFYQDWNQELFHDYLHRFELKQNMKIEYLSKGMKMKFSLAAALSHDARLIIMDEPTSGLDPVVRTEVLEILQQLIAQENRSILFSSHISSDIEKIADYITFINEGKIVFSESREDIADRFTLVRGPLELLDRDTAGCFDAFKRQDSHFSALSTDRAGLDRDFGEFLKNGRMSAEPAGIDEIMFLTVKGERYA